jgi:hypothetical protein
MVSASNVNSVVARKALACWCLLSVVLSGRTAADTTLLELSGEGNFPGVLVENVVVPLPGEIFAVLDKLGGDSWEVNEAMLVDTRVRGGREGIALLLGVVIAEGFVGAQAENGEAVRAVGRNVLRLADALGLRTEVEAHCQAILEAVEAADWQQIRAEFDRAEVSVRSTMAEMDDTDLAQCVSIGGWIRGTEVVAKNVGEAYTADRAELLNQALIIDHLRVETDRIRQGNDASRSDGVLAAIDAGLLRIEEILEGVGEAEEFSALRSRELASVCADLVARIREGQ